MNPRTRRLRLLLVMSHPAAERWAERQFAGDAGDASGWGKDLAPGTRAGDPRQRVRCGAAIAVVGHAAGAADALAAAEATRPDVALVDMLLPEGNGFALARQLRNRFPHLRVVMTGHETHARFALVARAAGAAGFLPLPSLTAQALVALAAPARAVPAVLPRAA